MMLLKSTNKALHWTAHARGKMRHYVLSEQRVKRVINSPKRIEEGIAPKTVAMMQSAGSLKHPYEIWVMVQNFGQKSLVKS
jgi:predicted metalloenzyme YecM